MMTSYRSSAIADLLRRGAPLAALSGKARHVDFMLLEPAVTENAASMRDVIELGTCDVRCAGEQPVSLDCAKHSGQGRDQIDPEPLPITARKRRRDGPRGIHAGAGQRRFQGDVKGKQQPGE